MEPLRQAPILDLFTVVALCLPVLTTLNRKRVPWPVSMLRHTTLAHQPLLILQISLCARFLRDRIKHRRSFPTTPHQTMKSLVLGRASSWIKVPEDLSYQDGSEGQVRPWSTPN